MRATKDVRLQDEKFIKGFLMISAEDTPNNQSSTLARGIIVEAKSRKPDFQKVNELERLSKNFSGFTAQYIKHVLNICTKDNLEETYYSNQIWLSTLPEFKNAPADNFARIVNNFALLRTSWEVLIGFLFEGKDSLSRYERLFDAALISVMRNNLSRVSEYRSDARFTETLWSLVESKKLIFQPIGGYDSIDTTPNIERGKLIGWYDNDKIAINMNIAYKEVDQYLAKVGGVGVSKEMLMRKLESDGKIRVTNSGKVSFGSKKLCAVEWTGEKPEHLFQPSMFSGVPKSSAWVPN